MIEKAISPGFAVLDFETGGLGPWEDILEIGVVLLDSELKLESEFATLVQPSKRVKNPWAHGIDEPQLLGAPTEHEAFAYLLNLLAGRYVVAHNAQFEKRFLDYHAELFRLSGPDTAKVKLIDTMPIAQELCGKRKLTDISQILKIQHNAHNALGDAKVTAIILQQAAIKNGKQFQNQINAASLWPSRFQTNELLPSIHRLSNDELFITRSEWLRKALFAQAAAPEKDLLAYQELVTFTSLNFYLSKKEQALLLETIGRLKLNSHDVMTAHKDTLSKMGAVKFPSKLLNRRSYLLTNLSHILGVDDSASEVSNNGEGRSLLVAEHKIMLSGRLSIEQEAFTRNIQNLGFRVVKDMAEADIVVIGHVDSTNRQIEDARKSGKIILTELAFSVYLG